MVGPFSYNSSSQCSTIGIKKAWYVLSSLWDGAYKRSIAANRKRLAHVTAMGFLSGYLRGFCFMPYLRDPTNL